MVEINKTLCVGCGACVKDCFSGAISLVDECAKAGDRCNQCGHCVAICPSRAVSISDYPMDDVVEYKREVFDISAETMLNFIKFRRSIRQFKKDDVEEEKIRQMIEAGRHIPTGGNRQNIRYILVKKQLPRLRQLILKSLNDMVSQKENVFTARYGTRFRAMYQNYQQDPDSADQLFFFAPVVLVVVSDDVLPAALASTGMELVANALRLGCLFSGFSTYAINSDVNCRNLLGLSAEEKAVTTLVIGYPDVAYRRTAPRKAADLHTM